MAEDLFDALEAEALGEAPPPAASLGRAGQTVNVSQLDQLQSTFLPNSLQYQSFLRSVGSLLCGSCHLSTETV